jgi:hypothetical protein
MEGSAMKADEREIRRKRRVLEHADESGNVAKTCRYFGIPRSSLAILGPDRVFAPYIQKSHIKPGLGVLRRAFVFQV